MRHNNLTTTRKFVALDDELTKILLRVRGVRTTAQPWTSQTSDEELANVEHALTTARTTARRHGYTFDTIMHHPAFDSFLQENHPAICKDLLGVAHWSCNEYRLREARWQEEAIAYCVKYDRSLA